MAKLLALWAMAQKYGPILMQLVSEIIDKLNAKTAAGVKMSVPPDQMAARVSDTAEKVADFLYAADCCVEDQIAAPKP